MGRANFYNSLIFRSEKQSICWYFDYMLTGIQDQYNDTNLENIYWRQRRVLHVKYAIWDGK